jgi:MFS family permease
VNQVIAPNLGEDVIGVHRPVARRQHAALLVALTLAYAIGYVDRSVLNLLVAPIQADLGLSDVQISLLQGLGFSVGFLIFSPIFGRLAGITSRRNLLMATMAMWSIATALMAVSHSFGALFALRVAIGAAEASISPLAFSMIGDAFDRKGMARAFSLFMLAPYVGGGAASLLGGLAYGYAEALRAVPGSSLHAVASWQITFFFIGAPSALASALLLLVREPARPAAPVGGASRGGFMQALRAHPRYYGCFFLGMALLQVPLYVYAAWLPTTAIRVYGAGIGGIGALWGLVSILCGCAGTLLGPSAGSWLRRVGWTDEGVRLPLLAVLCTIPCHIVVALAPNTITLVAAAGLGCFFAASPLSVASSGLRLVTPSRAFGMAIASYAISVMIAGIAVAPTLVAFTTQHLFGNPKDVGHAVGAVCIVVSMASAALLFGTLRPFRKAAGAELNA